MKRIDNSIYSFFQNKFGFHFDEDKRLRLEHLLLSRMKKYGLTNDKDYLKLLCSKGGDNESQFLIAAFTVGETYFFRNSNHWKALKNKILPEIIKRKLNCDDKSIRIWSAACSSGEESYTIAIVIRETIPFYQNWNIEILATDINELSLSKAKNGKFTENAFRETPDEYKKKYFSKTKGAYKIHKQLKQMITFEQFNLICNNGFPKQYSCFDIIFCRNALMYFSPEIALSVVSAMYNALNHDGYLFLGHTEGPLTKNVNLKPLSFCNAFVYQKQDVPSTKFQARSKKRSPLPQKLNKQKNCPVVYLRNNQINENPIPVRQKNYFAEALHLFSIGKINEAQHMLNQNNENQNLYSLILVGLIYIHKKDLNAAQVIFEEARLIYDLTPETHMLGAMIHEEMNNISDAINGCRNAIFLDQNFFYPHLRLGEIYRKLGDQKKKQKSFSNALRVLNVDNSDRIKLFCAGYNKEFLEDYLKSI
jgi:chemotaxis protein methyltransferase CheR